MFSTNKKPLRVLVACETSGTVRNAFASRGHSVVSVDLLPAQDGVQSGEHVVCDVLDYLRDYAQHFDLMIAHPPCTHLAVSGARWFKDKHEDQKNAIDFFLKLTQVQIPAWCIENPVSVMSTHYRKPDQRIQPWQHGHPMQKTTCLWLKNLPLLQPTNVVDKGEFHVTKSGRRIPAWYNLPERKSRWQERSKTFEGVAQAMAAQWG
jgi:site-specific DNA-cytosine methylase